MTQLEIGWVAGIIEGEGSFAVRSKTNPTTGNTSRSGQIQVAMTDPDILRRLAEVTGVGHVNGPYVRPTDKAHWKPLYHWTVSRKSDLARILLAIYPLLGERRKQRVAAVLAHVWA